MRIPGLRRWRQFVVVYTSTCWCAVWSLLVWFMSVLTINWRWTTGVCLITLNTAVYWSGLWVSLFRCRTRRQRLHCPNCAVWSHTFVARSLFRARIYNRTHLSTPQISAELGISCTTVIYSLYIGLSLTTFSARRPTVSSCLRVVFQIHSMRADNEMKSFWYLTLRS